MSRKQLTSKQHAFLQFLAEHVRRHKVWPTYREIVDHFGYRSPNSVTQNLQALTKKGYLLRDQHGYRIFGQRSGLPGQGLPVQGTVEKGTYAVNLSLDELTLKDLVPDLDRTFAVEISDTSAQGLGLDAGDFVLMTDGEVGDGERAGVVHDGVFAVCRVFREQGAYRLQYDDGREAYVDAGDAGFEYLGRYAGHINRQGLFRQGPTANVHPLHLAEVVA